jgi:hypothetical protein
MTGTSSQFILAQETTAPPKVEVTKTDNRQQSQLDAYRMRAAMQLGLVAVERAKIFRSSLPLEREELEKLMEKA